MNRTKMCHAAVNVLAALLLMLTAACATAPRKPQQPLAQWSSPEDCTTEYAAATSGLSFDRSTGTALLVDSIGRVWNCTTIPPGRFDIEVVVRWSNGYQETALDAKNFEVAPGQRLVARAYELGKGAIPASFSDVRVSVALVQSAGESATPAPAPEPAQALVGPERSDDPPAAAPDHTPSSRTEALRDGPHPALKVAAVVGAVVLITALVVLSRGEFLRHVTAGGSGSGGGIQHGPRHTSLSSQPSSGCCFVWIEDGRTGEVIAGNRPSRN